MGEGLDDSIIIYECLFIPRLYQKDGVMDYADVAHLVFPETLDTPERFGNQVEFSSMSSVLMPDCVPGGVPITYHMGYTGNGFKHYALMLAYVPFECVSGEFDSELIPTFCIYQQVEGKEYKRVTAPFEPDYSKATDQIKALG